MGERPPFKSGVYHIFDFAFAELVFEQECFNGLPSSGNPVEHLVSWKSCRRAETGPLRGAHTLQELQG